MNETEEKRKIPREIQEKKLTSTERIEILEKWKRDVHGRLENITEIKTELAEFVFQAVAVITTLIAVIFSIFIGFSANWNFKDAGMNYIIGLLGAIFVILLVWLFVWGFSTFRRKPNGKAQRNNHD